MSKAAAALARRRWSKRSIEKVCPHCGVTFKADKKQTYCTAKHQNAAAAKRYRDARRLDPLQQLHRETEHQRRNDIRDGRDYL